MCSFYPSINIGALKASSSRVFYNVINAENVSYNGLGTPTLFTPVNKSDTSVNILPILRLQRPILSSVLADISAHFRFEEVFLYLIILSALLAACISKRRQSQFYHPLSIRCNS